MKPCRFKADPSASDAADQWNHWFKTFSNFINAIDSEGTIKLPILINFLSPAIYKHVKESTSYETAVETPQKLFVKPKNEVIARHLLANYKQDPNESLNQYLKSLKLLTQDCNFRSHSAEECKNEHLRDAFINGIYSSYIRQRLLENKTIDLDVAFEQACSLEVAKVESENYIKYDSTITTATSDTIPNNTTTDPTAGAVFKAKCFFCGFGRHPQIQCSTREAICKSCGKVGHYSKVCKSKPRSLKPMTSTCNALATMPLNLSKTVLPAKINGKAVDALLDTGSSQSFFKSFLGQKV